MSPDDSKVIQSTHNQSSKGTKEAAHSNGAEPDFSHIDKKKLLRKMDWRLIPNLSLLYLLNFLDRGNIGNAAIQGLAEDLKLTGPQYNWCLTVFFFTYGECIFTQQQVDPVLTMSSSLRASQQSHIEAPAPFYLVAESHCGMWHRHDPNGHRAKFPWPSVRTPYSRDDGGRLVSWCSLLPFGYVLN